MAAGFAFVSERWGNCGRETLRWRVTGATRRIELFCAGASTGNSDGSGGKGAGGTDESAPRTVPTDNSKRAILLPEMRIQNS